MSKHRFINIILLACVIASLLMAAGGSAFAQPQRSVDTDRSLQDGSTGADLITGGGQGGQGKGSASVFAAPTAADPTKVPHYFGPWPNWANSPYTVPSVVVTISGNGTGATGAATVGANGAITGLTVTNPGTGYTAATVAITGAGTGATATAGVTTSGIVTAVNVSAGGTGFTAPVVAFSGGGGTGAAGDVYGHVETTIAVSAGGANYTAPTVEFDMPDDPNGMIAKAHAVLGAGGVVTSIVLDDPGSGYLVAPNIKVYNGTLLDPIACGALPGAAAREKAMKANSDKGRLEKESRSVLGGDTPTISRAATAADCGAVAKTTLSVDSVALTAFGANYTSAPAVGITDSLGTGTGAVASAVVDAGGVTSLTVVTGGTGYVTPGGIKKFVDPLPGLCNPAVAGSCAGSKYIPVGVPDTAAYAGADTYVIGLVQYKTSFSSSLPDTLVRGYVQLETAANASISQHWPVVNTMMDGTTMPVMKSDGVTQWLAVTPPQWLGPTLVAAKDKPVRIVFYNLLPKGMDGDLFLPVDSSLMGSGMGPINMPMPMDMGTVTDEVRNPMCTDMSSVDCFKQNRATLHLHGGTSPWISDGTTHQWITPATENTPWPQGVSVSNVPDMAAAGCDGTTDGCMTFFYTNQQSARLLFYHDHAWGITRLNVYAGEAAGYVITDPTEQKLFGATGPYAAMGEGIPLVVQDRTFVPQDSQLYDVKDGAGNTVSYGQDPTWDKARWGGYGSFWYHHVYMPAQNPGDPSGMSAYGRWMYGPWFWPPATPPYGPIANPYFDPACDLNDPATWTYQVDPFCEPAQIPGTPNISVGMEQFNDTPIVNGTAYPTLTLKPQVYRFRILSAANDRFFNFQWYVADPNAVSTSLNQAGAAIGGTEVALNPAEVAAAQTDPNVFPTALKSVLNTATNTVVDVQGPDWVQIGTEGGFLPAPAVVDGQQVTTWIIDPTRFDVGNVDQHSLLLAPAERADVIVDFSQFDGKTLILYNDAPAAFPARVSTYDYYTGAPDLSPNGAPAILPGYGPNTRTIMQVKIDSTATAAPAGMAGPLNVTALKNKFSHKADGSGAFEASQHPIIVGQAAYNSAYGKDFAGSGWCADPTQPANRCDGYVRISDYGSTTFNTLLAPAGKMTMPLQPKAIHDEMNSTTFDEYGRMQANLGIEAQPPTPGLQNVTLYPFVNPATELIDATNLPKGDVDVKPISSASDGTQIWRITHNGVDTHPIHWHLYDVQVLNRVTWDNIIIPPDPGELGWKDTVRISPLEDTIVALRPIIPTLPFEIPNAIRELNPMMVDGSQAMFFNVDPQGNPTNPIVNQLVNFGWEYVYHCHILSHEEMDMMRPVSVALPPIAPSGLAATISGTTVTLRWDDNSITETAFVVQRNNGIAWSDIATIQSPLNQANTHGVRTYADTTAGTNPAYQYRVVAQNTVGYGAEFPAMTVSSTSATLVVGTPPAAPTNLTGTVRFGPGIQAGVWLVWTDNATNEAGFVVQRSTDGVNFTQIATAPARTNTGLTTFVDSTVLPTVTYTYRVAAYNGAGTSAFSNLLRITYGIPAAPSSVVATAVRVTTSNERVSLTWTDNSNNEAGFTVQRATNSTFTAGLTSVTVNPNATTYVTPSIARANYYFRVRAFNDLGTSAWVNATPFPVPPAP